MNNKRHLIELPEEVVTALLITRLEDGRIGFTAPKGEPHMMESMALTFGVFVSILQGGEQVGITELERVREGLRSQYSLEEMRERLARVAVNINKENEEAENE